MSTKDTPKTPARDPKAPATPEAPPIQEYPKMLYHEDGRQVTVANKDEEAAAKKDGFSETPQAPKEEREKRRD